MHVYVAAPRCTCQCIRHVVVLCSDHRLQLHIDIVAECTKPFHTLLDLHKCKTVVTSEKYMWFIVLCIGAFDL